MNEEDIEKDIKNEDVKKNGDAEMPNGRTIYIVFGVLIGAGIVSLILGTIFEVEDITFYILRYYLIIIAMVLCYFGAIQSVSYRKPTKVLPSLILFALGILLILLGFRLIALPWSI